MMTQLMRITRTPPPNAPPRSILVVLVPATEVGVELELVTVVDWMEVVGNVVTLWLARVEFGAMLEVSAMDLGTVVIASLLELVVSLLMVKLVVAVKSVSTLEVVKLLVEVVVGSVFTVLVADIAAAEVDVVTTPLPVLVLVPTGIWYKTSPQFLDVQALSGRGIL